MPYTLEQWWHAVQCYAIQNKPSTGLVDPPSATTSAASSVTPTTATLNGTVSANGASTTVEFEYGTSSGNYTSTATAAQSPVTGQSVAVSAAITLPGVTTYYRVQATNSAGTTFGSEKTVTTLTAELVAYWTLDETSGTRFDSHNSNHLTDNNTVGSAVGKISNAASFNGSNESLTRTTTTLDPGTSDFTIAAWFKTSTPNRFLCSKGGNGEEGYSLGMTSIGTFAASIRGTSNTGTPTPLTYDDGLWHFTVVQFDRDGDCSIFIDDMATAKATNNISSAVAFNLTPSRPFTIANHPLYNDYWSGEVDEVGFWMRLLTQTERAALYNSGAGLTYPFV